MLFFSKSRGWEKKGAHYSTDYHLCLGRLNIAGSRGLPVRRALTAGEMVESAM